MKKYIGIYCLLVITFIAGCIDDRGNYDYISSDEVFPVKITGLDTSFNCLVGDVLRVTPIVTGRDEKLKVYMVPLSAGNCL